MRKVYRISGADRVEFLQGLATNDMRRLPAWAALLTPQGKYLADFFVIDDGDSLLLDVDETLESGLMARLNMYKLRSEVMIAPTGITVTRGTGPAPDGAVADPRHPALGWRGYGVGADDGTDWDAIRVAHCIPETGIELTPETYILEAGFERLNGVDFRKGCYVGQEVTARMKHKTELRKGLMTVAIDGTAPPGTPILRDGREVGTVYTSAGGKAIAQMRFDRIGPDMVAGDARIRVP